MGTLLSSSILRITKSAGKLNLPTSMSIFSAIPTGYWNDWWANHTLILVGFRVSRDNFAYKEYGMRFMLAPRIDIKDHSFSLNFEIELLLFNSNYCIGRKLNLPTSMSIFSAIPTGYWNDCEIYAESYQGQAKALHEKAFVEVTYGRRKPYQGLKFW
ncbi:hypothetical protein Tco_0223002 [Tanacetum coccineum]